jgi:hypothetical protein
VVATDSSVGVASLRLCETLQSFSLVAHCALDLDDLVASRTPLAVDGLELLNALADLVPEIGELLGRVLCGRIALVASSALDLGRNGDPLEPAWGLDAEILMRLVEQSAEETRYTSRSPMDRTHACYDD